MRAHIVPRGHAQRLRNERLVGAAEDEVLVKARIQRLISQGRALREGRLQESELELS